MNRYIIPAALAAVLTASACAAEPESGIVEELEHEEAYSDTTQICTSQYDAKGKYKGQTCRPSTTYYAECYEVDYYDEDTDTSGEDCVGEDLFEALEVGDEYFKGMEVSDVR